MSTNALLNARQQIKQHVVTPVNEPVYQGPKTRAEFDAFIDNVSVPSAEESIAKAKSLFSKSYKRSVIRKIYNAFNEKQRGMCCIAGGLDPQSAFKSFDELDDIERQKVRKGIEQLDSITKKFERKLGNVKRLSPNDFH
ncbi:hypothetical protein [Vibrio navarrensis]|uniref:hypothetical protein n=1 Tax=Vibrio navarrensis TaxID=29495 RepID=UPI00186A5E57|nr:hypothetical protein [Vibrio navarrensis]